MDDQWYVGIASMNGPGVADSQLVSLDDYVEYQDHGWDLRGPYNYREASMYIDKLNRDNRSWNHYNKL